MTLGQNQNEQARVNPANNDNLSLNDFGDNTSGLGGYDPKVTVSKPYSDC